MECHKFSDPRIQELAKAAGWKYAGVLRNEPDVPHTHMWAQTTVLPDGRVIPTNFRSEGQLVDYFSVML